jgi:hypothetical protein
MPTIKSHANSSGHAYFKHTGRYNELTRDSINRVNNDSSKASVQKKLARKGKNSAAAKTTKHVIKELGWVL